MQSPSSISSLFKTNKVFLLALLSSIVLAAVSLYVFELKTRSDVYNNAKIDLSYTLETKKQYLKSQLQNSVSSINFLDSTPPISGIRRSLANNNVDPAFNVQVSVWQTRLAEIFTGFMRTDETLSQARYITLANQGQELIRVDRINKEIIRIEGDALQKKGQRDYMLKASMQNKNTVYISPINYNRENGEIQRPYTSTYRVAKPVFDEQGFVFAVLVTNYFAEPLLANLPKNTTEGVSVYLLNSQDQFLYHPDSNIQFGFEFGQDVRWADVFNSNQEINSDITLSMSQLPKQFYLKERLHFEGNIAMLPLELAVSIDSEVLLKEVSQRRNNFIVVLVSLFSVILFLVWLYQRYINRKLELHSLKEQNNKIIENSLDAILTIEEEGVICQSNYTARANFNLTDGVTKFTDLFTLKEEDQQCIASTINAGTKPPFEAIYSDETQQQQYYSITLTSVYDVFTQKHQVAAILRDINSLKTIQSELQTLNNTLEQKVAQRTVELETAIEEALAASNAKSDFVANISHEIRTPMNGVLGMLGMLGEEPLNEQQSNYLNLANSSATSLMTLINDILDFSKIEAGKLDIDNHSFDVITVCSDMITSMALQGQRKGLEVILNTDKVLDRMLVGDSHRLKQILINLLNNAFKFTHQGEVSLSLDCKYLTQDKLIMSFAIQDSGIGIAAQNIEKLFEVFTQEDNSTTRHFGGTGLGLSICRKLAQLMGGDITVESEKGKGSCFTAHIELHVAPEKKLNTPIELAKDIEVGVLIKKDSVYNNINNLLVKNCQVNSNNIQRFDYQFNYDEIKVDLLVIDNEHPELEKIIALCEKQNKKYMLILRDLLLSKDIKATYPQSCHVLNKPLTQDQFSYKLASIFGANNRFLLPADKPFEMEEEYDLSDYKVLLVDDNMINLEVAKAILRRTKVNVTCANDGIEAIEILKQHQNTPFNVILMDCQMPNMNGYEATAAIRKGTAGSIFNHVPIIAMTASAMAGDRDRCIAAGMNDYLTKPIKPSNLKNKLAMWIGHNT
ncbi:ATP-binding protein [Pseudoalteromonas sp. ZZD1]|uniref:ATP-binding protein n=1 Tax=Pseudoalteromonas sp. ZZD1 TaxID=3139395 RepID=UPI003BADA515